MNDKNSWIPRLADVLYHVSNMSPKVKPLGISMGVRYPQANFILDKGVFYVVDTNNALLLFGGDRELILCVTGIQLLSDFVYALNASNFIEDKGATNFTTNPVKV